jgi:hypothetical protein
MYLLKIIMLYPKNKKNPSLGTTPVSMSKSIINKQPQYTVQCPVQQAEFLIYFLMMLDVGGVSNIYVGFFKRRYTRV